MCFSYHSAVFPVMLEERVIFFLLDLPNFPMRVCLLDFHLTSHERTGGGMSSVDLFLGAGHVIPRGQHECECCKRVKATHR